MAICWKQVCCRRVGTLLRDLHSLSYGSITHTLHDGTYLDSHYKSHILREKQSFSSPLQLEGVKSLQRDILLVHQQYPMLKQMMHVTSLKGKKLSKREINAEHCPKESHEIQDTIHKRLDSLQQHLLVHLSPGDLLHNESLTFAVGVSRVPSHLLEDINEENNDLLHTRTKEEKPTIAQSQLSEFERTPPLGPSPWNAGQLPPKRSPDDLPSPTDLSVVLCRLRDELPAFFDGHHSFGMYADKLVFQSNLLSFQLNLKSLQGYKMLLKKFKLTCVLMACQPRVELIKITKQVDEGRIRARWRVVGVLRLFPFSGERSLIDGFSTFDVNSDGLISRHQVDKVMPSDDTEVKLSLLPQILVITGIAQEQYPQ